MKRSTLSLLLLFLIAPLLHAQATNYFQTIQIAGNECSGSVAVLRSGDVLATGVDFTSNDILLLRWNSDGTLLRTNRISGAAADEAQAVLATSDGGAVVIGSTSSFGEGNTDAFIMKVRASGTLAWKRTFGTSGNEHFVKIVQTPDRGFIVLGDTDHDPNLNDVIVAKFNARGRPVWRKVISAGTFDHASGIGLTSDNGAIVAIAADFPERVRSVLVKLTAGGSVEWSRIYGSSGNHVALSVIEAEDGGYYFTETFTPSNSQRSGTVLSKLDPAGIPEWSRIYKSRGTNLSATIATLENGTSILLAGNTVTPTGSNSQGILIGLDLNGRPLWRKKVKPNQRPSFIGQPLVHSAEGSILVSGCSGAIVTNDMDTVILKTQMNGNFQGGCSRLTSFPLSNARFTLPHASFDLEEIEVPFFNASAGFRLETVTADESVVCSGE